MVTRMEKDKSDSVWLYTTLETIGVSEMMRQRYRYQATVNEILITLCSRDSAAYIFGSTFEGTTTPDMNSDYDILMCLENDPVIEQLPSDFKENASLMITDPDTAAGYVKLQVVIDGLPITSKESESLPITNIELENMLLVYEHYLQNDNCGRLVWNNYLNVHNGYNNPFDRLKVNKTGPAHTLSLPSQTPLSSDFVHAFRCRSWPSVATEWVERVRRYDWPQPKVIERLKTLGCFIVRVGHPNSNEQDLEKRLSFSLQERELMLGLNDVQHKCYVLLKLIKKDLITEVIGNSITSYHCKTCLFYMIERNSLDIWRPENLLNCVKKCLRLLLDWTKKNYCPNYFIPTENMFDGRIKGYVRDKVIQVFNEVLSEGLNFCEKIKTDNIYSYFRNRNNIFLPKELEEKSRSKLDSKMFKIHFAPAGLTVYVVMRLLHDTLTRIEVQKVTTRHSLDIREVFICLKEYILRISKLSTVTEHTTMDTRKVFNMLLPFLHTSLASHLASLAMVCNNKTLRTQYIDECILHYKHGMVSDVTSGRLKYLTFLYYDGQYNECERQLMSLEREYRNYVTHVSICGDIDLHYKPPIRRNADISTRDILRTYIHVNVFFLPTEYPLIPDALQFEMFRSFGTPHNSRYDHRDYWYDWVIVDSRAYLYFLWYLLAVKMNKPTLDRFLLMFKLILSSFDLHTYHRETAFNLISWVCAQEGFIPQALQFLILSWNEVKVRDRYEHQCLQKEFLFHHNAAKWHMLLLLKRVWQVHPSNDDKMCAKFCFHCLQQTRDRTTPCDSCRIAQYCSQSCKMKNEELHKKICQFLR